MIDILLSHHLVDFNPNCQLWCEPLVGGDHDEHPVQSTADAVDDQPSTNTLPIGSTDISSPLPSTTTAQVHLSPQPASSAASPCMNMGDDEADMPSTLPTPSDRMSPVAPAFSPVSVAQNISHLMNALLISL